MDYRETLDCKTKKEEQREGEGEGEGEEDGGSSLYSSYRFLDVLLETKIVVMQANGNCDGSGTERDTVVRWTCGLDFVRFLFCLTMRFGEQTSDKHHIFLRHHRD